MRDRGCRAGGQKLPSEIVATVDQFEPPYEVAHCQQKHKPTGQHSTSFVLNGPSKFPHSFTISIGINCQSTFYKINKHDPLSVPENGGHDFFD